MSFQLVQVGATSTGKTVRKLPLLWRVALASILILSVLIGLIAIPGANAPQRTDAHSISQVWVPAGCFKMGSDPAQKSFVFVQPSQQPAHAICLTHGYWIDQYDVTNAAFDAFMKAGGYSHDEYWSAEGLKWRQVQHIAGPKDCTTLSSAPQQPRICIAWYEAEAYANWRTQSANDGLVYRLPTEAEWEYAARGPLSWIYVWGNTFDGMRLNACDNPGCRFGAYEIALVSKYEKSWVNAYDMAGNVWQWMADWYDPNYYQRSPKNDPTGPTSGTFRVLRGGDMGNSQVNDRSAFQYGHPLLLTLRFYFLPDSRDEHTGIRLVGAISS